ncbi:MAG: hypothetical protein SGILL_009076 [Bacillariaceae sp.]
MMAEVSTENDVEAVHSEGGDKATTEESTVEESTTELAPPASSPEEEETKDSNNKPENEQPKETENGTGKDKTTNKNLEKNSSEPKPTEPTATKDEPAKDDKNEKKKDEKEENQSLASGPVVSSTKRTRPPYKYDPEKVILRFLFANKDGLTVTVECKPGDTVGEVKGQLLSAWPEGTWRKFV